MIRTDFSEITYIEEVLLSDGVVVLPTDTIYGLATTISNVDKLFEMKNRDNKPIAILVADMSELPSIIELDATTTKLFENYTPGAITIVGKKLSGISDEVTCGLDTIGIRIPDFEPLLHLLRLTGPLCVTSANMSGGSELYVLDDIIELFQDSVDLYVEGDNVISKKASTVVNAITKEVIRQGELEVYFE